MIRPSYVVAVVLLLSVAGVIFAALNIRLAVISEHNEPRASVPQPRYDFGIISPGTELTTDFAIVNSGHGPLKISDIKTTCGCTTAVAIPEELPSGTSGCIRVSFRAPENMVPVHHLIFATTNEPGNEQITLELTARPVWPAVASPTAISFSIVDKREPLVRDLEVFSPRNISFRIKDVRVSSPTVVVEPVTKDADDRHLFRIHARPERAGTLDAMVELVTDLPDGYTLRVPVSAQVIAEPTVTPSQLLLGARRKSAVVECSIKVAGEVEPQLVNATIQAPGWKVSRFETRRQESGDQLVTLDIEVPTAPGFYRTTLSLHSSKSPPREDFILPLSCYVTDTEVTSKTVNP